MPSGNYQYDLTSNTGNAIVEILNVRNLLKQELSIYEPDYYPVIGEFVIESCDLSIVVKSLANAPFSDTDPVIDTKSEQAAKIFSIWSNYPKVGLQMYLDTGNGIWRKQGDIIVVQSRPFTVPVSILKPYLASDNNFKLLGKQARLGCQIISSVGWEQLAVGDTVTVKGDWRFTFELKKKITKSVDNILPITLSLAENVSVVVRPNNTKRVFMLLTNDGLNNVYIYFGDKAVVENLTGLVLAPGETLNFLEYKARISQQITAICPLGTSRLIGMEGTALE